MTILQKFYPIIILVFLLFGCGTKQDEEKSSADSLIAIPSQKQIGEDVQPANVSDYDMTFESANQKLFVKWVNEDSIQYSLSVKTSICNENYTGGAFELISADDF